MIFLTKSKICDFLCNNTKYYKCFKETDMLARKIKSISEYFSIISSDSSEFDSSEKQILKDISIKADKILSNISLPGFDGKKASCMRWKIGCMSGERYEGGHPHTVKGTIILFKNIMKDDKDNILKVLIHEKVHIYQRRYKKDIEEYLKNNNFIPLYNRKNSNARANPDVDGFTYYNVNSSRKYESNYRTSKPTSFDDITNKRYEHPYEEMAYRIEKLI